MNGIDFLADTNILLYILEGRSAVHPFIDNTLAISVISEIELLGWYKITKHDVYVIRGLLSNCFVIDLLPSIKDIAIEMKQQYKLKLPDAVIAATAIHLQVPLLTADKNLIKLKEVDSLLIEI